MVFIASHALMLHGATWDRASADEWFSWGLRGGKPQAKGGFTFRDRHLIRDEKTKKAPRRASQSVQVGV
jgi:hypothetical protein